MNDELIVHLTEDQINAIKKWCEHSVCEKIVDHTNTTYYSFHENGVITSHRIMNASNREFKVSVSPDIDTFNINNPKHRKIWIHIIPHFKKIWDQYPFD